MKNISPVSLSLLILGLIAFHSSALNFQPVIGIIDEPVSDDFGYNTSEYSYIAGSYVTFLESAGARVAVIPWDAPNLTDYLSIVNGVLLTGGETNLTYGNGTLTNYTKMLGTVLDFAIEANKKDYYPLFAICQGFEALAILISQNGSIQTNCTNWCIQVNANTYLTGISRMFSYVAADVIYNMSHSNLTYYSHYHQINVNSFYENKNLDQNMTLTAYAYDGSGNKIVGAFEHKTLPIYGTQFHPEKNPFEWNVPTINHQLDAIRMTQSIANFFVQECRKSSTIFNTSLYSWLLVYNFQYILDPTGYFSDIYLFNNSYFLGNSSSIINN